MTRMNGAKHDVEDILASIRTSIADRQPAFDEQKFGDRRQRASTLRNRNAVADEALDFELPAIFKAAAPPPSERPNLLGRLSEALSANGQPQPERRRTRTVIPFEPAHGRMIEPPPVAFGEPNPQSIAVQKLSTENDGIQRVMPSFFDTRLNRMGAMGRPPEPAPAPPVPEPVQHRSRAPEPPRLPEGPGVSQQPGGGIEDAAAQLLRPILQQWLTDNMPRIVERALLSEEKSDGNNRY
ncbi:DUF2497 domain-containing protein [Hyphomicrobium methylovorum]|uniref:DUF2497 domain-containing protein n=1 Tax=Hyphomicrobium methylovorum TaxID=84 RepID=UPI0015E68C25|nr:DUF2497 domain-containing protein [Hyphomicrobium methylovorum]MBA2127519.1 DUF2497 domain-containing protein [Hyphomicrobium methylovorum]